MVLTMAISRREIERQAALVYEGETFTVALCEVGSSGFGPLTTVTDWLSREISDPGYEPVSVEIEPGTWSATEGAYLLPDIDVTFTAGVGGIQYDRVVAYITGATYIHSLGIEDPFIVLAEGQSKTYRFRLVHDD
jgi:hypothetical protein